MTDTPIAPPLKPCPFCGEAARAWPDQITGMTESIGCPGTDCEFAPATAYMALEDAITAWNTRAALEPAPVTVQALTHSDLMWLAAQSAPIIMTYLAHEIKGGLKSHEKAELDKMQATSERLNAALRALAQEPKP